MNKRRITAFLTALLMTSCMAVSASAEDYFYDGPEAEVITEDAITFTEPSSDEMIFTDETVFTDEALTEDSAEYDASSKVAKPTVTIKSVFGGKTITFNCSDKNVDILYQFGSSDIIKHGGLSAKPGQTIFVDKAMSTGLYYRARKNNQWSDLGKCGFNNVRLAGVKCVQSGPASAHKYKLYTEAKNSYIVYTLDGSYPRIEEGTNSLKVKNGRIVWGTSAVIEIPAGRTVNAIAIRCGLVTSYCLAFTSPVPPANQNTPAFPNVTDYGFTKPSPIPEPYNEMDTKQIGYTEAASESAAKSRISAYTEALRSKGFTLVFEGRDYNSRDKSLAEVYSIKYNNKIVAYYHAGYALGSGGKFSAGVVIFTDN